MMDEIKEQLAILGHKYLRKHNPNEFKQGLDELIQHDEWKSLTSPTQINPTTSQEATSQLSPPAYTKEKVGQCYFADSEEGFFLHAGQADHNRQQVLRQNRGYGRQQGHCDSDAQHSLAPDPDATLDLTLTDSYTSSPDPQERRFIKRKVLRKHKGQSLVCDESVYSEDSDSGLSSSLEERLADLHLSTAAQRGLETENEDVTSQSDAQTSETEGISMSAYESYIRGMAQFRSNGDMRPKLNSFIRPVMRQQTIKKTDPVAKYFQYKQLWETFKPPGESDRRALRQEIRDRLAYQPPPTKPRRVFVPNTYIVPTEKKRWALRWQIRNDLANGVLPHKSTPDAF